MDRWYYGKKSNQKTHLSPLCCHCFRMRHIKIQLWECPRNQTVIGLFMAVPMNNLPNRQGHNILSYICFKPAFDLFMKYLRQPRGHLTD